MTMSPEDRRAFLRAAIEYSAAVNSNTPSAVRRLLATKFQVDVLSIPSVEVEAECSRLAGDSILQLADLARKVAR